MDDMTADGLLRRVTTLADGVLWPQADGVDRGAVPVVRQLDLLAQAGLYGIAVPVQSGGLGATDHTFRRVVEVLAGADLTTTFVWIQHQGVVKRIVRSTDVGLRRRWLGQLASGRVRAGVGVGGVRPPSPTLTALQEDGTWVLDGTIPWVSGWGLVDVLLIAARVVEKGSVSDGRHGTATADSDVVWLLIDAPQPTGDTTAEIRLDDTTVSASRYNLVALDHARSAAVRMVGHRVGGDRLVARQRAAQWALADAAALRTNGSLSLGLAVRCLRLLDEPGGALDEAIARARQALEAADEEGLPESRASAARLAWEAAGRLLAARGGRSVARRDVGQRLAREAMVLQVFGTRPEITQALLRQSGAALGVPAGPRDAEAVWNTASR